MVARQRFPKVNISQLQMTESHNLDEIEGMTAIEDKEIKEIEMVPWKNTFDMRPRTLAALASTKTLRPQTPLFKMRYRTMTSAAKSLDILRQNLQAAINKEIDLVIKKYLEKFFQPAIRNVRENLGSGSVTEELIREVCRAMLEEAKQMYCSVTLHKSTSPPADTEFISPEQVYEKKRKLSDPEISQKKRAYPPFIKWDPSRVNKETQFILSTTANKILGLGCMRNRLSIKHPDIVKYTIDQDDREWLNSAGVPGLIQGTPNVALMLLEDIVQLANFDEYRQSALLNVNELKGFVLPDFIQRKVRAYMTLMRTKYIEPESPPAAKTQPDPVRRRASYTQVNEDVPLTFDDTYLLSTSSTGLEGLSPNYIDGNISELSCVDPSNILPSYIRIQQPIQMSVGVECLSPIATTLSTIDTGGLVEFDTSFLTLRGEEDD